MKIIILHGSKAPARPKIDDRKLIKGVEHIRRQDIARDHRGRCIGHVVSNGRPVCSWVPL